MNRISKLHVYAEIGADYQDEPGLNHSGAVDVQMLPFKRPAKLTSGGDTGNALHLLAEYSTQFSKLLSARVPMPAEPADRLAWFSIRQKLV